MSDLRYQVLLFDLGGTLIYFDGDWPQVFAQADQALFEALQESGLVLEREPFLETFRNRQEAFYLQRETEFIEYTTAFILRDTLAQWGYPDVPFADLRPALNAMYAVSQSAWRPESDALPTLERLRKCGYQMGLISNAGDDDDVQALVDKAALRPFFEIILSSAGCGIRKPNPRIFFMALDVLQATPDQAVMVGDTLGADILGAQNAGIFNVWITRRADNPANQAHADTIHPDATIGSLSELPSLLERLNGSSVEAG